MITVLPMPMKYDPDRCMHCGEIERLVCAHCGKAPDPVEWPFGFLGTVCFLAVACFLAWALVVVIGWVFVDSYKHCLDNTPMGRDLGISHPCTLADVLRGWWRWLLEFRRLRLW